MRAVRFVGKSCVDPAYTAELTSDNVAIIDTLSNGNVTIRFEIDGKPMRFSPAAPARDLLDLAAAVYIVDEINERAASPDYWSRSFGVVFPVDDPSAWNAGGTALQDALHQLSGDTFEFTWPKRGAIQRIGKRSRAGLVAGYDAVCLFSGGIDSLLGAIKLLEEGKRVYLVGHQAEGITSKAQKDLFALLSARYPRVHLIQARVARSLAANPRHRLPDKVEDSHRPRSFLFLGLAVAVAITAKVNYLALPENGLIALNAPLQRSRMGTLSTRTAHPLFVDRFREFLADAALYTGTIENPFLYKSKTDMLRDLDEEFRLMFERSVSCAHAGDVRWIGKPGVRHCGYCVPCIYRRAAMIERGWDDPDDYGYDVFNDLSALTTHKQADFRALFGFANRVVAATRAETDLMVLSHGVFAPDIGGRIGPSPAKDYSPWSEMLLRWSRDYLDKVQKLSSSSTKQILGIGTVKRRA